MAGEHAGGTRPAEVMTHFSQLARHGGLLQMRDEIFEPKDSFHGQAVEVLEQGQGVAVILFRLGPSSARVSPLVTDHSNNGIRSWAATDCSNTSTRSSSTVSMTIKG